jgi:PST family polysaccharide transporter
LIVWFRGKKIKWTGPRWDKIWTLVKPTFSLSLSGLLVALRGQVPILVCGLTLSPEETGYFSWGFLVASQSVFLLATNLREVLLPAFAKLQNDPGRRVRAALKAAHVMTSLLCVACGAQALLAGPLIKIFVPEKWVPAIPIVLLSSLGLVFQGLWISGTTWLNAQGRYRLLLNLNAQQTILVAGLTWLGVTLGGLKGAALGCAAAGLGGALLCLIPMGREFLVPQRGFWLRPLGLSAVLWTACYFSAEGRRLLPQLVSAGVFTLAGGWIWWREDQGGLRLVFAKFADKIKAYRPSEAEEENPGLPQGPAGK